MALVLRSTKGSALTHTEMDANFSGLADGSLIAFASALVLTSGQIAFPATQSASTDANTLDDYEETDWTPSITFDTPGDLSVSYSTRVGKATKIGRQVHAAFSITTSAFTFSTSTGNARIAGLPYTSNSTSGAEWVGALSWGGITKATYTNVVLRLLASSTSSNLIASGSGVAVSNVAVADMPSGGTINMRGTISYIV